MNFQIDGNPDYGQLRVRLGPGETFIAEGGAMAWMDTNINIATSMRGGLLSGIRRYRRLEQAVQLPQFSQREQSWAWCAKITGGAHSTLQTPLERFHLAVHSRLNIDRGRGH